jgi:hypothetical protein
MLAGIPGIKPDRMITRFVADAPDLLRSHVTPRFALQKLVAFRIKGIAATDIAKDAWCLLCHGVPLSRRQRVAVGMSGMSPAPGLIPAHS